MPFDYNGRAASARAARQALDNFKHEKKGKKRGKTGSGASSLKNAPESDPYQKLVHAFWVAIDDAYPPGFDDDFAKLSKHQDMHALETAVAFLEADPFFFRSGYVKEKLLRHIRGYHLPVDIIGRLQQVILNVVDHHYCREFSEYRKLARKVDNDYLRLALADRAAREDPDIRKRALFILRGLENKPAGGTAG